MLEVGFGLGISAGFIQQHEIKEHHIIEANAQVFAQVVKFAESAEHKVVPVFGFWEEVIHSFLEETFDGILYDTSPVTEDEQQMDRFSFFKQAYRLLKKGGVFTQYSGEVEFTPLYREL